MSPFETILYSAAGKERSIDNLCLFLCFSVRSHILEPHIQILLSFDAYYQW